MEPDIKLTHWSCKDVSSPQYNFCEAGRIIEFIETCGSNDVRGKVV